MWLHGDSLVVLDRYGVSVIDVSNPEQPRKVKRLPAGTDPKAVYLDGSYAYLFLSSGLFVLDVASPGVPELLSFQDIGPVHVVRREGGAYQVRGDSEKDNCEVDLSDPKHPSITKPGPHSILPERPILESYTYRASCGRLRVEDTQGNRVIQIRLAKSDCGDEWDVALGQGYAYVVGGGTLYVFDTSDPASPKRVAEKLLPQAHETFQEKQARIRVEGRYAFVLHNGLWVLDLQSPEAPVEVAYYPTNARAMDVDAEGRRIALVGEDGTFTLFQYDLGEGVP
jgi:hypothetical protein